MAVKKKAIKKGKVTVKKSKKTVHKAVKPAAKKATTKAKKTTTKKVVSKKNKPVAVKKVTPKKALKKVVKPTKKVAPKKIEKVVLPKVVKEPKIVIPHTPPQVVYPDKNAVKARVRTLLISQPKPENEKNPYLELARRLNIKVDFRHFIKIEGITSKEFRQQRINLTEHNAVILTSRNAVDHFFRVCGEMRYN